MAALCWWSSDFKTLILNDLCVEISSSVGPREPENKDDILCFPNFVFCFMWVNLTLMADRSAGFKALVSFYQQVCCSFSNTSANMRWTPAPVFIHSFTELVVNDCELTVWRCVASLPSVGCESFTCIWTSSIDKIHVRVIHTWLKLIYW